MAKDAGWGRRLRSARRAYVERHDAALTYEEIGVRVGRRLGRAPFKHTTVRAWFAGGQEPDSFEVARALAVVLEQDAGYLMTGDRRPAGGAEEFEPMDGVALTETQLDRADRAATKRSQKAATSGTRASRRKPTA